MFAKEEIVDRALSGVAVTNHMTWLPIATCPRDGSEFLAYDPVARKFDVCVWRCGGWDQTQADYGGPDEDEFHSERATLWTALPVMGVSE